jgi:hypothetical protein
MSGIETNLYFAKSGLIGNPWRTSVNTLDNTIKAAKKFVRDWRNNGLNTSAVVFYRDGSVHSTITINNCD